MAGGGPPVVTATPKIALRDMEIRGMGNLIGREQHGHIAALGFDLYSRLLAETVDRMREITKHWDLLLPGGDAPDAQSHVAEPAVAPGAGQLR